MKNTDKLIAHITSYTNEELVNEYAQKHSLTYSKAKQHLREFLKFATICTIEKNWHTPSKIIDPFWHFFLAKEEEYENFEKNYLWKELHHIKYSTPNFNYYQRTLNWIKKIFWEIDSKVWSNNIDNAAICWDL